MAEHLYWHATTRNRWRLYNEATREPTEDWVDLPHGMYPVSERDEELVSLRGQVARLDRMVTALKELVEESLGARP